MTIRLKPDALPLSDSGNHYNLELYEWERLNAGLAIVVDEIPPQLVGLVDEVTEPEMEG